MTMPPVLIVEDEAKRAALLVHCLRAAGLDSALVHNGLPAVPAARERAVLLDVMLPGQDGMAVCHELLAAASARAGAFESAVSLRV
jgi:CheY-like chemotaxis protein